MQNVMRSSVVSLLVTEIMIASQSDLTLCVHQGTLHILQGVCVFVLKKKACIHAKVKWVVAFEKKNC